MKKKQRRSYTYCLFIQCLGDCRMCMLTDGLEGTCMISSKIQPGSQKGSLRLLEYRNPQNLYNICNSKISDNDSSVQC